MSKDLYISLVEELMEEGFSYEEASEKAYPLMQDRLADLVDYYSDQMKGY